MIKHSPARSSIVSACLLWALLVAPLGATDRTEVAFRGLSVAGDLGGIYFDNARGESQEFRVSDHIRSEFYHASSGQPLNFYKILPAEKEGGEPLREVLGTLPWPAGRGPFLVVASESGGNFEFSIVQEDESSFPMGSFRVYNASQEAVNVRAAEQSENIPPGDSALLRPSPPEGGKGILFQVVAIESDKLYYSNVWSGSQTKRTLVFVVNRDNPNYPIGVKRVHESDLALKYQREK